MKREASPLFWTIGVCIIAAASAAFCGLAARAETELPGDSQAGDEAEVAPEAPITDFDRDHWAFEPLVAPALPDVSDEKWCRNPIDRFILQKLEEAKLAPMPEAGRETLLRRLVYDMTGLPPTAALRESFLQDQSPGAYEKLVDELLSSPAFGEHWAQHWLDLVRFAETDGFEHDHVRPNAWRYRDWVIQAINSNMPYDEFVRLQLAGDEVRPDDPQAVIATGFLLCGPDMPDINLQQERRHVFLNDMTGTVGGILMGLTFECAACHDHRYDPISQRDFYRLRAFFETAELFHEQPIPSPEEEAAREAFERRRARRWKEIEAELAALKEGGSAQSEEEIEKLQVELNKLKKETGPQASMARAVRDMGSPPQARLWVRGDFRRPGPELEPSPPRVVLESGEPRSFQTRADLADWLTAPDNPLTARVIVNRLWQYHFGVGLCETTSDFGLMGAYLEQEELLDWLASELVRLDWDLKAIHRLMVTSTVYRLSSRPTAETQAAWDRLVDEDPENRLWGRRLRRRLSGEMVRDSLLAMRGELNGERYGPGVRPPLPPEVVNTLLKNQWPLTKDPAQHNRRSIYLFVRRNLTFPLFQVLDKPDTNRSCPRRNETTIAPQALQLMNSPFMYESAERLAEVIARSAGDDAERFVSTAFLTVLGRLPSSAEREASLGFLNGGGRASRIDFCLTLFNTNAFLYVD